MKNGIYHVRFSSQQGSHGEGLVVVKDGAVNGGDPGYLYLGTMLSDSNAVSGRLEVKRWNTKLPSIFGPLGSFSLDLSGTINGDGFTVTGNVSHQPALRITISGRRLSDVG